MSKISFDLTQQEVLNAVAEYLSKKYNMEFESGSIRPCYDTSGFTGYSSNKITGYNFSGNTKE